MRGSEELKFTIRSRSEKAALGRVQALFVDFTTQLSCAYTSLLATVQCLSCCAFPVDPVTAPPFRVSSGPRVITASSFAAQPPTTRHSSIDRD